MSEVERPIRMSVCVATKPAVSAGKRRELLTIEYARLGLSWTWRIVLRMALHGWIDMKFGWIGNELLSLSSLG